MSKPKANPFRRAALLVLLLLAPLAAAQNFFPLKDIRPGLHGIGRTVFEGDRIEEFQVEILGVLQNLGPKQTIILARLSGGPLAETGVLQGMSGSPVYIDGKLLGAIALGFPFSKQPIAGIQPIEAMLADATFSAPLPAGARRLPAALERGDHRNLTSRENTPPDELAELPTPLSLTGFSAATLTAFMPGLRNLGFQPQEGVSAAPANSPQSSVNVRPSSRPNLQPGAMISVGLITGDMNMTADGTVTYIDGKRIYAFGHRFLDVGSIELPFARSEVIASIPTLNSSFKLSVAREWMGTILSDRNTAVAGEIGRPSHTVPLTISVRSGAARARDYHLQVVNDRLLTPFLTQAALFSTIDATERTVGAGTMRLQGKVEFDGALPPLRVHDLFVSDSALAQQVSADAVVTLGFVLSGGFANLHLKDMSFQLDQVDSKRQLHLAQAWTSAHEVHPGDSIQITALLEGENGLEMTRVANYQIPTGAPNGPLNLTVSDANTLNFPDFAGVSASSLRAPERLIEMINSYRASDALYVRVWRQEPSFNVAGQLPGGELPDPPPSVMLILADPSASANSNAALTMTRGAEAARIVIPVGNYVVTGAKTIQVEVKD
jgi:SpoIVB peptidase S55